MSAAFSIVDVSGFGFDVYPVPLNIIWRWLPPADDVLVVPPPLEVERLVPPPLELVAVLPPPLDVLLTVQPPPEVDFTIAPPPSVARLYALKGLVLKVSSHVVTFTTSSSM